MSVQAAQSCSTKVGGRKEEGDGATTKKTGKKVLLRPPEWVGEHPAQSTQGSLIRPSGGQD